MKEILSQWSGKFEFNNDVEINLDNLKVSDGDEFHVRLLPKREEIDDEDLLSAY